jgi:hypothetical protein
MRKILIQLDADAQPSAFDRVVAIDAGADEVFSYGGVRPEDVEKLVHGAIFTRHPRDLKSTAIFVGGSDMAAGERLFAEAQRHMIPAFGLRVSLLLDPNGSNTTAAAAVRAASRHVELKGVKALVLGGTGPVGQRAALILARHGAEVRVGSRQQARSATVCEALRAKVSGAALEPVAAGTPDEVRAALAGRTLLIAAGAAGVRLVPREVLAANPGVKVAIDLNATPPLGIEGVEVTDRGKERGGVIAYGAIGVGDTKMKVHKAAVARLFESNDQVLDAEEVYVIAESF